MSDTVKICNLGNMCEQWVQFRNGNDSTIHTLNDGSDFISNFMTQVSNNNVFQNDIKKKLFQTQDREKLIKRELSELKTEHQWLLNNQKSSNQAKKSEESGKEIVLLEKTLKEEKDKVKNLTEWKSQLSEKNKELKQENEKYV